MVRVIATEAAASFLKFIAIPLYAVWSVKLGIIDANTNPLFAIAMVVFSIYGLWVIAKRISDYLVRSAPQHGQAKDCDFGTGS